VRLYWILTLRVYQFFVNFEEGIFGIVFKLCLFWVFFKKLLFKY